MRIYTCLVIIIFMSGCGSSKKNNIYANSYVAESESAKAGLPSISLNEGQIKWGRGFPDSIEGFNKAVGSGRVNQLYKEQKIFDKSWNFSGRRANARRDYSDRARQSWIEHETLMGQKTSDWPYAMQVCAGSDYRRYGNCFRKLVPATQNMSLIEIVNSLNIGLIEIADSLNKENIGAFKDRYVKERNELQAYLKKLQSYTSDDKQKEKFYLELLETAVYIRYGNPEIGSARFNAAKQVAEVQLKSYQVDNGNFIPGQYDNVVEVPVKEKYANKYIALLEKKREPVVVFNIRNNDIQLSKIEGLNDPVSEVEKSDYDNATTIEKLGEFIKEHPSSSLISKAKEEMIYKEKQNQESIKKQEERRLQNEIDQKRESDSFASRKQVGDKICRDYTILFSQTTIEGFVEQAHGDKVQIRIYYGGALPDKYPKGSIIWDDYSNWRYCSY